MEEEDEVKKVVEGEESSSKEDNKEKNRSDRWMSVYLPLAWSAQLGNGIVQTITGHRLNRTEYSTVRVQCTLL